MYQRIHRQVAHLSTDRIRKGSRYEWRTWLKRLPDIHDELTEAWNEFLRDGPLYKAEFKQAIRKEQARLKNPGK